ncbi:MAG: response regulator [Bacteroidota bacterium]
MSPSPRLLCVAAPSEAGDARTAIHLGGAADVHVVASGEALQAAFGGLRPAWDAVVVVPGGPVADVEVAAYVPDGVRLFVVAPEVPLLLTETAAEPVLFDDLPTLVARLESETLSPIPVGMAASGDGAADVSDPSFLTLPDAPGAPTGPTGSDPSTPMLDSSFSRPPADSPSTSSAPEAETAEMDEPVLIVRAKSDSAASDLPEVSPPEEATIVEEPDEDRQPAVLVVEDNDDTRMLLERILRSTYDVRAVGDARSALLAMNEVRFAGLVLDINLGGKETGADVLRIARSLSGYEDVFAIALTAYALPGDRERLLESGFNEYISKPFTRQSLMETLSAGILA